MKRFDQLTPAGKAVVIPLYARARGYQAMLPNGPNAPVPNPETPAQFCQRILNEEVVRIALQQRSQEQVQVVQSAAVDDSDIQ